MNFANGLDHVRKLLVLLLLSVPLAAQQGVWGERGISRRFAVRGDLVYAADGRGVSVYDVANPAAIVRIDVESGDAESRDLAFLGPTDLILATSAGLERFAVQPDGTLQRRGTTGVAGVTRVAGTASHVAAASGKTLMIFSRFGDGLAVESQRNFGGTIRALTASGNIIYAAVERTAIYAIDAATGETVTTFAVNAQGLAVSGNTLWAAADIRGLFAIDLAGNEVAGVFGAGQYRFSDVAASGSRVYAVESPNRVHIFDGSEPDEPELLATLNDWVNVVAAGGSRLFMAGAIIDSENLPLETGAPLRVYEGTALAGEFRDLAGPISGVWTDGSIAYVVDPPFLRILDISTTSAPREIGSVEVPNIQDWIRVKNGLAINYGRTWVNLIDLSRPRRPKLIGSWFTQGHAPSFAALARDTVIEANAHSGLHVVDYTNPANMVQISGRIMHYHDVAAGDDAIYALQSQILLTLDLTERTRATDRNQTTGQYQQLETLPPNAAFPHHLVVRSGQEVTIYSLMEDRFSPRFVATVPLPNVGLLATNDTTVFAAKDGLLHRMEVASPSGFTPTDMVVTSPMQISVAGEKVVIADRYRLRIYGPNTAPVPAEPVSRRRAVRN